MTEDQKIQLRVQALAFANNLASTLPPQQVIEAAEKYFAFMAGEKPAVSPIEKPERAFS